MATIQNVQELVQRKYITPASLGAELTAKLGAQILSMTSIHERENERVAIVNADGIVCIGYAYEDAFKTCYTLKKDVQHLYERVEWEGLFKERFFWIVPIDPEETDS